jgi:hypothetical protein
MAAIGYTPWSASPAPSSVTGSCRQPAEKGRNGLLDVLTDNIGEGDALPQAEGIRVACARMCVPHHLTREKEECNQYTFYTKTAHR